MKIFTNKNLIQKLIIAIVIVTMFNFCIAPMQVKAAGVGGWIINGVRDLALIIPDALISIAQYVVTGTFIDAVEREVSADVDNNGFWQKSVKYPIIQLSPELIFADEVEILSVDFINGPDSPNKKTDYIISAGDGEQSAKTAISTLRTIIASWYVTLRTLAAVGLLSVLIYIGIRIIISSASQDKAKYKQRLVDWLVAFCLLFFMHYIMAGIVTVVNKLDTALADGVGVGGGIPLDGVYGNVVYNKVKNFYRGTVDELGNEILKYGPQIEKYIKNLLEYKYENKTLKEKCELIEREQWSDEEFKLVDSNSKKIYFAIKDTNIFGNETSKNILVVEVFTPDDYMGHIGNPTYNATPTIPGMDYITSDEAYEITYFLLNGEWSENAKKIIGEDITSDLAEEPETEIIAGQTGIALKGNRVTATQTVNSQKQRILVSQDAEGAGSTILYYINYARLYCNANSDHNPEGLGFTILYTMLVVMTVMFLFRYFKRVIYVAFLTMIAPLVALTYPLDKIKDGRAQAFNMWIREYIFNILIQPFHLLIYGILVGGAMELAHAYWIYGVVCMAFLIPAEKLLRKFFGFDNAGTLSAAGSFAGGALFSTMLQRISRPKPKDGKDGEGKDKKGIHMKRSPNSSGGVDVDSTVSGAAIGAAGTAEAQLAIGTGARTRTSTGTRTDSSERTRLGRDSRQLAAERIAQARETAEVRQESENQQVAIGQTASGGSSNYPTIWGRFSGTGKSFSDYISMNSAQRREAWKNGASARANNWVNIGDAVAGHYKEKAIKGFKELPQNARRFTRRAVVGGIAGGALAITGAAVGAASGDAGSAMKLGTAAAAAGYYGANFYGDKEAKNVDVVSDIINEAFWNEQNKARNQYLADQEFKNSEENIRMLAQFTGSMEEAREVMRSELTQQMLNEGITDPKLLGRAYKLRQELEKPRDGDGRHLGIKDSEQRSNVAVAYAKMAQNAPDNVIQSGSHQNKVYIADRISRYKKLGYNAADSEKLANHDIRMITFMKEGIY